MDNLGTEVGQKMRSAVKAKLIELGTGGSAGYIDDELPDYVMIMVANKRSKEQMVEDLNLFLGTNTQTFVNWLHQVLEKLQEVTVIQKTKRKSNETGDIPVKKDKKDKKKDKKSKRHKEKTPELGSSSKFQLNLPVPSITDVFANQLIQKAKKSMEIESLETENKKIKTKMEPEEVAVVLPQISVQIAETPPLVFLPTDDFDIPTITEIAECAVEQVVRRKEITELEELQKRINLAKRQLRAMGSEESEDEDFLSIKEDGDEFDDPENNEEAERVRKSTGRNPSPIVFTTNSSVKPIINNNNSKLTLNRTPISYVGNDVTNNIVENKKRSILDRLGDRPSTKSTDNIISITAHRQIENEIFVPNFRRKEKDKLHELKEKQQQKKIHDEKKGNENDDINKGKSTIRQRIGSRVIVAPPRPEYDEEIFNFPVNSVVKVKPRPIIPANRQANKNLLLKAVAEAQKSTAMIQPRKEILSPKNIRTDKNRNNKVKKNIVIEIPSNVTTSNTNNDGTILEILDGDDDDRDDYVFVQRETNISEEKSLSLRNSESKSEFTRTQFVVTLDGIYENDKKIDENIHKEKKIDEKITKPKQIEKSNNGIEIRQLINQADTRDRKSPIIKKFEKRNVDKVINRKPVKKLIIKSSDTTDDEKEMDHVTTPTTPTTNILVTSTTTSPLSLSSSPTKKTKSFKSNSHEIIEDASPRKRCKLSPIKFDIKSSNYTLNKIVDDVDFENKEKNVAELQSVFTKKSDSGKKYDNIPPLLSAVTVPLDTGVKIKSKERCKYYPICRQGDSCEFYHPTMSCKSFPNCKFGDKCLYIHPKCKFDLTCTRPDCNFQHTPGTVLSAPPPLASHVVPVQNYKTISTNPLPAMCKFYPGCTNVLCTFYHPKICRFGKNCLNKVECNFFHHELPSKDKLKWISPANI